MKGTKNGEKREKLLMTASINEGHLFLRIWMKEKLSLEPGSFGENLFLEGANIGASTICIHLMCKIQVTQAKKEHIPGHKHTSSVAANLIPAAIDFAVFSSPSVRY